MNRARGGGGGGARRRACGGDAYILCLNNFCALQQRKK